MRLGIRGRVLLIAWGPAALIAIALAAYFVSSNLSALRDSRRALGLTLSHQLAPAALYGILTRNRTMLAQLIHSTLSQSAVSEIAITSRTGRILVAGSRPPAAHSLAEESATYLVRLLSPPTPQHWIFQTPVILHQLSPNPNQGLFQKPLPRNRQPVRTIGFVRLTLSTRHVSEQESQIIFEGLLLMLAGLAATFMLAARMTRSITAPLVQMSQSVQKLSQGMMSERLPEHASGELGRLEQGINRLAAQIEQSTNQLEAEVEQATQELRETLEEVEAKNVALDLARKQAVAANRAKTDFLANINHEIRTPMNTILGYVDLLTQTEMDPDQREYLTLIQHSSQNLLELIDQVLRLSRIEAGHLDLMQEPCHIPMVLEEVVAMLAPYAWQKGLDLVSDLPDDSPPVVLADAGKLRQIFNNLIGNAIKFTEQGLVQVSMRQQLEGDVTAFEFVVADSGIGLSALDLNRIFEPFTQAGRSGARAQGGVGLGLAICRRLTEAMKGTIRVESTPNEGSRFIVRLTFQNDLRSGNEPEALTPLQGNIQLDVPAPFRSRYVRLLEHWGLGIVPVAGPDPSSPPEGAPPQARLTILDVGAVQRLLAGTPSPGAVAGSDRHLILAASTDRRVLRKIGRALKGQAVAMQLGQRELHVRLAQLLESGTPATEDPELLGLLRRDLPGQVASLKQAWSRGEPEAVREALHQLEGTAGLLRLGILKQALTPLHERARHPDGCVGVPDWLPLDAAVGQILTPGSRPLVPESATASGSLPALDGRRVLLAEDNAVNRALLGRMLTAQGAQVHSCSEGGALIDAIEREAWDVVLLDIHMPGLNGIATARTLSERYPGLPLIAISADILPEVRLEAMNAGIRDYLIKPIRGVDLIRAILNVLNRGGARPTPPQTPVRDPLRRSD